MISSFLYYKSKITISYNHMIMVIKITSAYCNSNIDNANANTTANVNAATRNY